MIYYHITPRENKEAILNEGLHSHQNIFLATSEEDSFILAPVVGSYYGCYRKYHNIYNSSLAPGYLWGTAYTLFTMFEIDGEMLDIVEYHFAGQVSFYERWFGGEVRLGDDRALYEYLTPEVAPQQIRGFTDYALPVLQIVAPTEDTISVWDEQTSKFLKMRNSGMPEAQIRALMLPPWIPQVQPLNMHDYIENNDRA